MSIDLNGERPDFDYAQNMVLGHAQKDVTEHYTHTDVGQLAAEIRKLA